MKIWIDITSLPHVHFFRSFIKRMGREGHDMLVTTRKFSFMEELLQKSGIEHHVIGSHGGKGLKGKLVKSSTRISRLAALVSEERPDVGLSKHSVECARVCFGMKIPSVMVVDHETATAAMRLMVPLTDVIVSPQATPRGLLAGMGANKIVDFFGVCETAHFYDFTPSRKVLSELGLSNRKKTIISRSEPMLSSHNEHYSNLFSILKEIGETHPETQTVFIPRSKKDMKKFRNLDLIIPESPVDTLSLYAFSDLMIGAGSCMNREACVGGCPTISICPDNLPAIDRFMISKGLMSHSLNKDEILSMASGMIEKNGELKAENKRVVSGFEDPYGKIGEAIRSVLREKR